MRQYTVLRGDTLYGIARQFDTTVNEIKRLNNLSNNIITVGQILVINEDSKPQVYVVQKGDSLYSIASRYGISVSDLINYNNLKSNLLQIGQTLSLVPTSKIEDEIIILPIYSEYKVVKGDSLYSIANKFNTTVNEIKRINNLKSNLLQIGQILKIKTGEEAIGIEECFGDESLVNNYITYKVRKGDSLYSIAKKNNTTVDNIIKLNNLKSNILSIGQELKIKEGI